MTGDAVTAGSDRNQQTVKGSEVSPCPQGRTDFEACFAPFRYCPIKGCGRAERVVAERFTADCPACGERFHTHAPIRVTEHVRNEFGPAEHVFGAVR